jgi:hypothetical protein
MLITVADVDDEIFETLFDGTNIKVPVDHFVTQHVVNIVPFNEFDKFDKFYSTDILGEKSNNSIDIPKYYRKMSILIAKYVDPFYTRVSENKDSGSFSIFFRAVYKNERKNYYFVQHDKMLKCLAELNSASFISNFPSEINGIIANYCYYSTFQSKGKAEPKI